MQDGTFKEIYTSEFPVKFTTKSFNFDNLSNNLTLNINENGNLPFAGIDAITLNACGADIDATSAFYTDNNQSVLEDILKLDLNVVISHNKTIQTAWNLPQGCSSAVLSVNANEYGVGSPFRFPESGTAQYTMGSNSGSLVLDGKLDETDGTTPLYTSYWIPTSGHPEGNVYLYAKDDANFLYFAGDMTIDNTDDIGSDWISITIGGRKFKVTDADNTYGTCSFGLTSKISYKHATCELKIPKNEISNYTTTVPFVLGYYGTSSEPFHLSVNSIKTGGDNRVVIEYNDEVTGHKSDYSNLKIAGSSRNILTYSGDGTNTIVLTFDGSPAGTDTTGTIDINNSDSGGTMTTTSVNNGQLLLSTQSNYEIANVSQTGDFFYSDNGTTAEISDYIGPGGNIIIPSTAGGYPVTSILGNTFNNKLLTSVTFPESITNIGFYSFEDNPMLKVAYFLGNAPIDAGGAFYGADSSFKIVYTDVAVGFDTWTEYPTEVNQFVYDILPETNNAEIIEYDGAGGDVVIPSNLFGYPVTSIGSNAFNSVGNSVGLISIVIPNTVTTINSYAFFGNSLLTSVYIGSGLTSISEYAFYQDPAITEYIVDPSSTTFSSLDGVLFNKNQTSLIFYPIGRTEMNNTYTIPSSVASISSSAFYGHAYLTSMIIPDTVTSIGDNAFSFDEQGASLESLTFGRGLTSIGINSFGGNSKLIGILNLPINLSSIGDFAFFNTGISGYNVDSGNSKFSSLDGVLFDKNKTVLVLYPGNKLGDSYEIPSGVISIGKNSFYENSTLTSVAIPSSVTNIETNAFAYAYASSLISFIIPENVTNIGDNAFGFNPNLTSAYFLGNAPSSVGNNVFDNASSSFKVYHLTGKTGFTNSWNTYPTETFLAHTQTVPDGSGNSAVNSTTPEVVITSTIQPVTVTVSSGTANATINVSSFIEGGTGILPQITINSEKADVAIPASTVVTSTDATWNGVIAAPTVTTVTLPITSGQTKTLSTAVEVGFTGAKLSFDKAVRVLLPGQAGKRAGYTRDGGSTFTEITNKCDSDSQTIGNALPAEGDCKIDVDSDLVIWTKHFTTFVAYTETASSTKSNTSSGSSVLPSFRNQIITPSKPIIDENKIPAVICKAGEKFNSKTGEPCSIISRNISKTLKLNMTEDDVKTMQIYLNTHGYIIAKTGAGSIGKETSFFGFKTKLAVIAFQKANKLTADGIAGPMTIKKMK